MVHVGRVRLAGVRTLVVYVRKPFRRFQKALERATRTRANVHESVCVMLPSTLVPWVLVLPTIGYTAYYCCTMYLWTLRYEQFWMIGGTRNIDKEHEYRLTN